MQTAIKRKCQEETRFIQTELEEEFESLELEKENEFEREMGVYLVF